MSNKPDRMRRLWAASLAAATFAAGAASAATNDWTLIGWNNLGMHCMDRDFSVMSLLPPFNTIHAHLIDPNGKLVKNPASYRVTYEAVADPDGSINKTSIGKGNFWQFAEPLYGVPLPPDVGLAGTAMPGPGNTPQGMSFETNFSWFVGAGIPITPTDDAGKNNTYPLMRLTARTSSGALLATTDVVLPVSDEMDCRACHSGQGKLDPNPERDYRLSILRMHDQLELGNPTFQSALQQAGYNTNGLFATATTDRTPILCAKCHLSEALPGTGIAGVKPLTQAIHSRHADVTDPTNGLTLNAINNRSACYRCHPGSETRCLRGAMGSAVAADGSMQMQCQSCHGTMSQVGAATRVGWLDEPTCQNCHTGTATSNNGQIRYTSVYDATGQRRAAVNQTFATNPHTPVTGLSLYRFSKGHGGLQCSACHGSTHAEYPSAHRNDNIQSQQIQGHAGVLIECAACHNTQPNTVSGGPHGMHPVGQTWVDRHGDAAEHNSAQCRACHGADYRGTVLSRVKADRVINADDYGTKTFWSGFQIGCYNCHNGPNSESRNPNRPAVVQNATVVTPVNEPVSATLAASDPDGNALTLRIVSQPAHGTVALNGRVATYYPDANYNGTDKFTFAAWDGSTDSNLGVANVTVGTPPPVAMQPDAMIKRSNDNRYTGVKVYNADGAGQTISQTIEPKKKRTFHIKVQNTGVGADTFVLRGDSAAAGLTVKYFLGTSGGSDITPAITGGTYASKLTAGAYLVLRVEITAASSALNKAVQSVLLTATSTTDAKVNDAVKAVVTVKR